MDETMRHLADELRQKTSVDAADWLLANYPLDHDRWGEAITLLEHVSLRRSDARRLADYYLSRAPYAADRTYRVFAKLLGVSGMLRSLLKNAPFDACRLDLLTYHLDPILRAAGPEADDPTIAEFNEAVGRR